MRQVLQTVHSFVIRSMARKEERLWAIAEESLRKKLAVYATLAVLAHAVIVVWHLFVLAKILPEPTGWPIGSTVVIVPAHRQSYVLESGIARICGWR
jgi:hypothetical protein